MNLNIPLFNLSRPRLRALTALPARCLVLLSKDKTLLIVCTVFLQVYGHIVLADHVLTDNTLVSYKNDIGYQRLKNTLNNATPDGTGVSVVQVEPGKTWQPDPINNEFAAKVFNRKSGRQPGISNHATSVGKLFYGNASSIAPGITTIDLYSANDWLGPGFLNPEHYPVITAHRVTNHSYVGGANEVIQPPEILRTIKSIDWLAELDEITHVVGIPNHGLPRPLLSSAFNVIAVGKTSGGHAKGTAMINPGTPYISGRTSPHIVAPLNTSSTTTPVVAAATALLISTAHQGAQTLSRGSTSNRNGDTIYNGERAEVIKAAIMAGADRLTHNTNTHQNIIDYRSAGHQTNNGLDRRFGAGQLNIYKSNAIISAGEQNSAEDANISAVVANSGFDYDPLFGGENHSNTLASYHFATLTVDSEFTASLVWSINNRDNRTHLVDINLFLYDQTDMSNAIGSSHSTINNTENVWLTLRAGHSYVLRVEGKGLLEWDYGLAWHTEPIKGVGK